MNSLRVQIIQLALLLVLVCATTAHSQTQFDRETLRWINQEPKISRIEIIGNNSISEGKIKSALFSREYSFFADIKNSRVVRLRRETLVRDTSAVKGLYLREGYLGVRVSESFVKLPDNSASIKIEINEGRRFRLGTLSLVGEYSQQMRSKLSGALKRLKLGKIVSPFVLRQTQLELKEIFANNGYPYARINYGVDTLGVADSVLAEFRIYSDSLVYFGEVEAQGTELYGLKAALRELKLKPGKLYRRRDIEDSQRRLLRSGYYTTALLRARDSLSSGADYDRYRPDFSLKVKERNAHFVTVRTGVAQDSIRDLVWEQQLGWGKRNFLKTRRFEANASGVFSFSGRFVLSHVYGLRYIEPWFLGIRLPLSITAEIEPGVKSQVQPFRIQRWRLDLETIRQSGLRRRLVAGLQYENVTIFDVDPGATIDRSSVEGISVRRRFFTTYHRDTRDDLFAPRNGTVVDLKFDYFGGLLGGDVSFGRAEASWSKFQPFFAKLVRATRIKFGVAEPFSSNDVVPSIDRFFIGGANSIRGFSIDELGPGAGSGEFSEGAEFYIIFNQELRIPIYKQLWSGVFFDAGNGWRGLDDPNISFDGAAYSYGGGLQYHSPAGPLRLDYAQRIRTKGIASILTPDYRWHFTILYAF